MPRKKLAESAWPQARHHATGIPIGEQAIEDGKCVVGGCSGMRRILSLGASAQPPEKDAWLTEANRMMDEYIIVTIMNGSN